MMKSPVTVVLLSSLAGNMSLHAYFFLFLKNDPLSMSTLNDFSPSHFSHSSNTQMESISNDQICH